MKSCNITDKTEIAALFLEYPVLEKICNKRAISVAGINPVPDIVGYGTCCAQGFNYTGWVFRIKEGKILSEITWEEIRKKQKELGLRDWEKNTVLTVLNGEEDMIVFVQEHHEESNYDNKWISMEAFICLEGKTFSSYSSVKAWLAQLEIREKIKKILV
jgi:hypothetical protein